MQRHVAGGDTVTTPTVPQHIHPGWFELVKCIGRHTLTRRKFLSAAAGGAGIEYHPYHLTHHCDADPDHSWEASHAKWNSGLMSGWVTAEGGQQIAIGYFEPSDHIYHVELARAFTLADHYFCAQIGPTLPNRLYLWSGTSGWEFLAASQTNGLPYNNPSLTEPPPMLSWPTMADVL